MLGAGSTEILDLFAKLVSLDTGNYVIADPSYEYWTVTLDYLGLTKNKVPLTTDKKINVQAMLEAPNKDTKLVYIYIPITQQEQSVKEKHLLNLHPRYHKIQLR